MMRGITTTKMTPTMRPMKKRTAATNAFTEKSNSSVVTDHDILCWPLLATVPDTLLCV